MALGSYDSPTFLGQKDKYIMGLSLPELMMALGVGFAWFLVSLLMPFSTIMRMMVLAPVILSSLILMFVRISGLTIPMFLILSVVRSFNKPSFEETQELVLTGPAEWLKNQEKKKGGLAKLGSAVKDKADEVVGDESRQAEVKAEVDKNVTEAAMAAEQWVRDGVRTLVKGR